MIPTKYRCIYLLLAVHAINEEMSLLFFNSSINLVGVKKPERREMFKKIVYNLESFLIEILQTTTRDN